MAAYSWVEHWQLRRLICHGLGDIEEEICIVMTQVQAIVANRTCGCSDGRYERTVVLALGVPGNPFEGCEERMAWLYGCLGFN